MRPRPPAACPGRDEEPARQLLNQSVHALRRALGADSIVSVGEELQFNPALVYCDVLEFEEALAKQDRMRPSSRGVSHRSCCAGVP